MSGIEPFQFEPVYQPGEEPPQEESVGQEVESPRRRQYFEDGKHRMVFVRRLCAYAGGK